jgi:hypothetical protein
MNCNIVDTAFWNAGLNRAEASLYYYAINVTIVMKN